MYERAVVTSGMKESDVLTGCPDKVYLEAVQGAVAQLGERINRTDEARGSSPLSSTTANKAAFARRRPLTLAREGTQPIDPGL